MAAVEINESKKVSANEYTGCSLCAISGTYAVGTNALVAKQFEEHLAGKNIQGSYRGAYVKAAICTVSEYYPDWQKHEKWLLEHGFKLLGIYPGAHPEMKKYNNRLYGSKTFELPQQETKCT